MSGAALPLVAQVRSEQARQQLEPIGLLSQERGQRVLADGEVPGVGEQ